MSGYDNNSWTTVSITAATYTATEQDYIILADPASNAITVTLPAPGSTSCPKGRVYIVRSTGTTNTVTIDSASGNVNGAATDTLAAAAIHGATYVNDGTDWFAISEH